MKLIIYKKLRYYFSFVIFFIKVVSVQTKKFINYIHLYKPKTQYVFFSWKKIRITLKGCQVVASMKLWPALLLGLMASAEAREKVKNI